MQKLKIITECISLMHRYSIELNVPKENVIKYVDSSWLHKWECLYIVF